MIARLLKVAAAVFLLQLTLQAQAYPWHFPGEKGNRFLLVANGFPRPSEYADVNSQLPRIVLQKAHKAHFTALIVNGSPSKSEGREGEDFRQVASMVNIENAATAASPMNIMVFDSRMMANFPVATVQQLKRLYGDRSVHGFFVDEPLPGDLAKSARWIKSFSPRDTSLWENRVLMYVNLFGFHVFPETYEQYVEQWAAFSPRLLSFDNYSLWDDERAKTNGNSIGGDITHDYFANLELFRMMSIRHGIPFGNWIQVHRHYSNYSRRYYRRATAADLRFQVYSAIAYGSKALFYYNFWNPRTSLDNAWHEEQGIVGWNGEESELFGEVAALNHYLSSIGETLLDLESISVIHKENSLWDQHAQRYIQDWFPMLDTTKTSAVQRYGLSTIHGMNRQHDEENIIVKDMNGTDGMIGIFIHNQTKELYLFVMNKNRSSRKNIEFDLRFKKNSRSAAQAIIDVATGARTAGRTIDQLTVRFTVSLENGSGKLYKLN
jgi:hypothetical protein